MKKGLLYELARDACAIAALGVAVWTLILFGAPA